MRTCPNCQAVFGDSEVFCPVCGQEIQIVPDFITMEAQAQEAKRRSMMELKRKEEELEREEMLRRRIRQRRRNVILAIILAAAAVAGVFVILHFRNLSRMSKTFSYQVEQAGAAYENGNWSEAQNWINFALGQDSTDYEARLLGAKIFLRSGKQDDGEALLLDLIKEYPGEAELYEALFGYYLENGRKEDIQSVLRDYGDDAILEKYDAWLPEGPELYPDEGVYNEDQEITIVTEDNAEIHYTTDGSEPTAESPVYSDPITVSEGITTIKALVITKDAGFTSPVSAAIYQIQYDAPPPPTITPQSGEYTIIRKVDEKGILISESDERKQVTLDFPDEYTCHYSWDKKPTEESDVYTKPISMEQGEHIFYAVLESDNGRLGTIASATYKYEIRTVTPTPVPTKKPRRGSSSSGSNNNNNNDTPEPTQAPDGSGSSDNGGSDSGSGGSSGGSEVTPAPSDGGDSGGGDSGSGGSEVTPDPSDSGDSGSGDSGSGGGDSGGGGSESGGGDSGGGGGDSGGGGSDSGGGGGDSGGGGGGDAGGGGGDSGGGGGGDSGGGESGGGE